MSVKGNSIRDSKSPHKSKKGSKNFSGNVGISMKEYSNYLKSKQMNTIGGNYSIESSEPIMKQKGILCPSNFGAQIHKIKPKIS